MRGVSLPTALRACLASSVERALIIPYVRAREAVAALCSRVICRWLFANGKWRGRARSYLSPGACLRGDDKNAYLRDQLLDKVRFCVATPGAAGGLGER